jgi:hypothetical protein
MAVQDFLVLEDGSTWGIRTLGAGYWTYKSVVGIQTEDGRGFAYKESKSDADAEKTVEKELEKKLKTLTAEQQSFEVCLAALKQNPFAAFRMIKNQTPEICLEAVKLDGLNILPLVKTQTPEICRAAVAQNPKAQMFVRQSS